jgi:hypothetical protein
MPPRWLTVAIVGFWLCTSGWLVYQEAAPLFLPAAPPPYVIDLEDEVQTQQAHVRWTVTYNDRECFRAETWVEPDPADDDVFAVCARVRPPAVSASGDDASPRLFGGLVTVGPSSSAYRVSRAGDLRSIQVEFAFSLVTAPVTGKLTGEVRGGRLYAHLHATTPLPGVEIDEGLKPVPVPGHGSVLSPLYPANRLAGLRPGQSWRQPVVDPLMEAFKALVKKKSEELGLAALPLDLGDDETEVVAAVLPEPQALTRNGRPVACLVVEYRGKRLTARTWVQADNGLVLRQEAERDGERLAMRRD